MQKTFVSEQAVIDGARELGRALGAARAFRDYEQALEQYQSDMSAADLIEQVRRLQQGASMQEMLWGDPGSDWAERLASLQRQMRAHPAIQALQRAEEGLTALLFGLVLRLGNLTGIDYAEACTGRSLSGCGPNRAVKEFDAALSNSPGVTSAIETLVASIAETEPYHRFEAAKRKFQHDPEVAQIRRQAKAAVEAYIRAQQDGTTTLEIIQQVRTAQDSLREHPVVQEFSAKRQEVHTLFQQVNLTVGEILGLDVAQAVAPAAGCCG